MVLKLIIGLLMLFSAVIFYEGFVDVWLLNNGKNYPFGFINNNPIWYWTENIYSISSLVLGIVFTLQFMCFWHSIKTGKVLERRIVTLTFFISITFVYLIQFIDFSSLYVHMLD